MITSFYTAGVAAMELQKGMDVVANNIANVSTPGYTPSKPSFADLLYTTLRGGGQAQVGHGVKLAKTDTVYTENGGFKRSERDFDFVLRNDNAYFAVQTPDGVRYTKDGSFHLSEEGGLSYLTSGDGGYVLDRQGNPMLVSSADFGWYAIGVSTFDNPDGLLRDGGNNFIATLASGEASQDYSQRVEPNNLAQSGVNLADEMSSVLQLQRAFQANTRIVQISDEVMQTINSLR